MTGPLRFVVAGVDEDPVDPCLEAIRVPKLRKPAPGEDEGVLQRVLGETRVAQDPVGDRIEAVADLVHQDGECFSVSLAGLFDEVSIHVDLRSPRPSWPRTTHYDGGSSGERSRPRRRSLGMARPKGPS